MRLRKSSRWVLFCTKQLFFFCFPKECLKMHLYICYGYNKVTGLVAEFSVILQLFEVAVGCWDIWEHGRAEPELWQKAERVQGSMGLLAQCLLPVVVLPVGTQGMGTSWNYRFRNETVLIWDVLIIGAEFSGRWHPSTFHLLAAQYKTIATMQSHSQQFQVC